jgi:DNA-binding transcriptional ArsR family regulator
MFELRLTEKERETLRAIAHSGDMDVGDVAQALGSLYPAASRLLASLARKGLVDTSRRGQSKRVSLSDTKHTQLFKRLLAEFGHMSLEHLLSNSSLEVLSYISEHPLSRRELVERSSLSDKTVKATLRRLRSVGIVASRESFRYTLAERFRLLGEFIAEFRAYLNQKTAEGFAPDSVVLWQRGREFIIRTEAEKSEKNFFPTATTAFHQHGVELLLSHERYYFYSPSKSSLGVEDVLLHTLVLDKNSTRIILSTLLLWEKNKQQLNTQYLVEKAEEYGLSEVVKSLESYLTSRGQARPKHFPSWQEYLSRAKEYGLS